MIKKYEYLHYQLDALVSGEQRASRFACSAVPEMKERGVLRCGSRGGGGHGGHVPPPLVASWGHHPEGTMNTKWPKSDDFFSF